jgi:predicted nucleic acid-binding protein
VNVFLDTNVVVYAYDFADPVKQARAAGIVAAGGWTVSTQVMQEFFVVTTLRLARPLSAPTALAALASLAKGAVSVDADMVTDAAESSIRNRISLWDALIVQAARRGGCERLLSEDLSNGQVIDGVTVENPFSTV